MEVKLNQLVYSLDDEKKVAALISNDNASGNIFQNLLSTIIKNIL